VLFAVVAVGVAVFFVSCLILRLDELQQGWQLLKKKHAAKTE
jgi:hypothetical protein